MIQGLAAEVGYMYVYRNIITNFAVYEIYQNASTEAIELALLKRQFDAWPARQFIIRFSRPQTAAPVLLVLSDASYSQQLPGTLSPSTMQKSGHDVVTARFLPGHFSGAASACFVIFSTYSSLCSPLLINLSWAPTQDLVRESLTRGGGWEISVLPTLVLIYEASRFLFDTGVWTFLKLFRPGSGSWLPFWWCGWEIGTRVEVC